jgi:hypothetical protein
MLAHLVTSFMDQPMMMRTEQCQIIETGLTPVHPMLDMMRIDKLIMVTTGKGAVPVTGL